MVSKEYNWHKVADFINELDFGDNKIAIAYLNNKKICIGSHAGEYFAFALKCPHAGGILANGHIDALGNVVCPLHRYKYSVKNGRNVSGEGYHLQNWPVKINDDGVFIGMEKTNLFGF